MKIHTISKTCAAVACALTMSAQAANHINAESMVQFNGNDINQVMGLADANSMKAVNAVALKNGVTKVRFQQYFNGVKVFGHSVAASQSDMGFLSNVKGQFLDINEGFSTKARITAKQALENFIGSDKKSVAAQADLYNKKAEQVIYLVDGLPRLANLVSFVRPMANGDISRPTAFIDAIDGGIIFEYDNLQTDAVGTGPGGNTKTGQYEYGTDFGFNDVEVSGSTCTMNNTNVKTINLNHGTSGSSAFSYDCPRNTVKSINGAYSPLNDAHFFGGVVFDMYSDWYNSAPLTFQLTMRVHYSNSYENAFWDGSAMTFGDGATTFYPLVSLDVSAHEVAHGFTEQNSSLVYSGMSGGMNEAYSDMAGDSAEYYMHGTNDWMVGEQIFKGTGALRYMNNPPLDNRSIGHADDFTSGMDVHYSSGVFNKAFYLLATTSGWNTKLAFDVMTLANQTYWTANSTFDEGACGAYNAAGDLGYSQADVRAAFLAVGVYTCDAPPPPPPGVLDKGVAQTISGATGSEAFWTYEAPAGVETVSFNMSGGTGDADIYTRFGSAPTSGTYDCRPYASGNNEVCDYPTAQEGTYHVMVNGYSAYSGVTLVGDHTGGGTPPPPPPGGDSGEITDISVASKGWFNTSFEVAAGASNLVVSTSGGTGDIHLFVKEGEQATNRVYDCRSRTSGNTETCTFAAPAAGTWHVGIKGKTAASGVTLNWSYE